MKKCTICGKQNETLRHHNINGIIGSDGADLCKECEKCVADCINALQSAGVRAAIVALSAVNREP